MLLRDLLPDWPWDSAKTDGDREITGIYTDSRSVCPGSVFVALQGHAADGMNFIPQALDKGASVVISHQPVPLDQQKPGVCYLHSSQPQALLRKIVQRFYGPTSARVKCVGVTGTNGKTTTAYLLAFLLKSSGHVPGMIGTIAYHIGDETYPSANTTPGFVEMHQWLSKMFQRQADYCVMEVSSHALDQGRVDLIDFSCAVFTNLTDEHLDYHKTKEDYFQAKARLFTGLSSHAYAVINVDDPYGRRLVKMSKGKIFTYAIDHPADVKAEDCRFSIKGTCFNVRCLNRIYPFETALIGRHNVENLLAGIAAALSQGISMETIQQAIRHFSSVKGRLEKVETGRDFSVIIDYAHTPDALEKILKTVRAVTHQKIFLIFGCGGDRDRTKRPKMGRIAGELADHTIVTSDNPRTEDPQSILDEIVPGFESRNFEVIVDRREAIAKALKTAKPGEVILIAGKGHEDYQILKTGKIPFDERVIVKECLEKLT